MVLAAGAGCLLVLRNGSVALKSRKDLRMKTGKEHEWLATGQRPWIIAHRGGAGEAPENTVEAFARVADRVAMIEMDVRLSADGQWVIIHDEDLIRTSNASGPVWGRTAEALAKVDVGYFWSSDGGRSFPCRGRGVGVPTLAHVLRHFAHVPLSIEIKERTTAGIEQLAALIMAIPPRARVIVGSEHYAPVALLRKLLPGLATYATRREVFGLLFRMRLNRCLPIFRQRDRPPYCALAVPEFHGKHALLTPGFMAEAQRMGVIVHVWTVNEEIAARRLVAMGVDGIVTDYPERMSGSFGR